MDYSKIQKSVETTGVQSVTTGVQSVTTGVQSVTTGVQNPLQSINIQIFKIAINI